VLARRLAGELASKGWRLEAVMTDNASEFRSQRFNHELAQRQAKHIYIRAGRPQSNGCVERVQQTLLEECWKPAFARYLTPKYTGLARDLEHELRLYNTDRIHQGRRIKGMTLNRPSPTVSCGPATLSEASLRLGRGQPSWAHANRISGRSRSKHWLELAAGRARGTDVQLLKQLATSFQDAESTLRPKVWTGPRLTALGKEMEARLPIEIQLNPISRVERFIKAIPVEVLMRIAVGTLVLRLALEVGDRVLKRLRRDD